MLGEAFLLGLGVTLGFFAGVVLSFGVLRLAWVLTGILLKIINTILDTIS
jgi:uncharacterized membrane protein (DUF485 family)